MTLAPPNSFGTLAHQLQGVEDLRDVISEVGGFLRENGHRDAAELLLDERLRTQETEFVLNKAAWDAAWEEGRRHGHDEAADERLELEDQHEDELVEARTKAWDDGWDEGYEEGREEGYQDGYDAGVDDCPD